MLPEPEVWEQPGTLQLGEQAPSSDESPVSFTLLGPLEIRRNGRDYAPTAPKVLQLLALLLLTPGRAVHIDTIIRELWSGEPPRSVRTTMQTYVYQLRKVIDRHRLGLHPEKMLVTKPPGYVFRVSPAQVDVFAFQQLCQQGKDALSVRDYPAAARDFRLALSLWSGSPLANVECGPVLSAFVVDLDEQQRAALHLRIQAELAGGMHRELIGELRSLVTTNPLDEGLHSLLMRALNASGRRSDAMATYHGLRTVLNRELGVEPCDDLQRLYLELLSAEGPSQLAGNF